jgi:hypothetical protein
MQEKKKDLSEIFKISSEKAFKGGIAGSTAMVLQVTSLMWLRTTMNYQYRYGTKLGDTFSKLYNQGGIRRFYRGIAPALCIGPLSRFGDTAANIGVLSFLEFNEHTKELPIFAKTALASFGAGLWRINLMPLDTLKTTLQVEGKNGLSMLKNKFKLGGPSIFYHGSLGAFGATYLGHFPWYYTFNYLNKTLPQYEDSLPKKLIRNAGIGFTASIASDTISNSVRVIKTSKQSYPIPISYFDITKIILKNDGLFSLMTRGLKTRLLSNGIQGMMFSVLWKLIMDNL